MWPHPCRMCSMLLVLLVVVTASLSWTSNESDRDRVNASSHKTVYGVHKDLPAMGKEQQADTKTSSAEIVYKSDDASVQEQIISTTIVQSVLPKPMTSPTSYTSVTVYLIYWTSEERKQFGRRIFLTRILHTVALLRTSTQLFRESMPGPPFTFSVDSTIINIVIEVNGSSAVDALIWDPEGSMINKRFRRSTELSKHGNEDLSQHQRNYNYKPDSSQHQRNYNYKPDSSQHQRNYNYKPDLSQHQRNYNYKPDLSQHQRNYNYKPDLSQHQRNYNYKPDLLQHQGNYNFKSSLSHQLQKRHITTPNIYNSTGPIAEKERKMLTYTFRRSSNVRPSHSLFKHVPRGDRFNNYWNQTKLFKHVPRGDRFNNYWNQTKLFKHFHSRPQGTLEPSSHNNSRPLISLFSLNHSQSYVKSRDNIHPINLKQGTASFQHEVSVSSMSSRKRKKSITRSQDIHHNRHRQRRASSLVSMELLAGVAVWEIEPPAPGLWTVAVDGAGHVHLRVTATSSLDFTFQLLDNWTMIGLASWWPLAYDLTVASVTLTNERCVNNVTLMSLYDDDDQIVTTGKPDGDGLSLMKADGTTTILITFTMPDVPFYMSITGYDDMGNQFQRLSSVRVVPRMFTLSPVTTTSGPFIPGNDYIFGVRLRNSGQTDWFKVEVRCANVDDLKSRVNPEELYVPQFQVSHLRLIIRIPPNIFAVTNGSVTVIAARTSDNMTETLNFGVMVEPNNFLQDHAPPVCTTQSTSGGCRQDISCQTQMWAVSVSVRDSLTGVRSAEWVEPPRGSFNRVQFSYFSTDRTAHADYRSICCNFDAALLVYDYANNSQICRLLAPSLGSLLPTTSRSMKSTDVNHLVNDLKSSTSATSTLYTSSRIVSRSQESSFKMTNNKSQIDVTWTKIKISTFNVNLQDTTGSGGGTSIRSGDRSRSTLTWRTSTETSQLEEIETEGPSKDITTELIYTKPSSLSTSVNKHSTSESKTPPERRQADGTRSRTLRLAAIICACVGVAAGLAIAVLCIVYTCLKVRKRRRGLRRRRNGSDITMGSSSESRSEGSSETGSVRVGKTESKIAIPLGTSEVDHGSVRNQAFFDNVKGKKGRTNEDCDEVDVCEDEMRRRIRQVRRQVVHDARERNHSVEDVTFKCTAVTSYDKLDRPIGNGPKVNHGDVSSNRILPSGEIHSRKFQILAQVEKMDKSKIHLSSAVSDCDNTPPYSADAAPNFAFNHYQHEISLSAERRAGQLRLDVAHETSAPGGPQLRSGYDEPQNTFVMPSSGVVYFPTIGGSTICMTCQQQVGHASSSAGIELVSAGQRKAHLSRGYSQDGRARMSKCQDISAGVSKCQDVRAGVSKCQDVRAGVSKCQDVRAGVSKCQDVRAGVSKCQDVRDQSEPVQANTGLSFHHNPKYLRACSFDFTNKAIIDTPPSQNNSCHVNLQKLTLTGEQNNSNATYGVSTGQSVHLNPFFVPPIRTESDSHKQVLSGRGILNNGMTVRGSRSGLRRHVHSQQAQTLKARRTKTLVVGKETWQNSSQQHPRDNSS